MISSNYLLRTAYYLTLALILSSCNNDEDDSSTSPPVNTPLLKSNTNKRTKHFPNIIGGAIDMHWNDSKQLNNIVNLNLDPFAPLPSENKLKSLNTGLDLSNYLHNLIEKSLTGNINSHDTNSNTINVQDSTLPITKYTGIIHTTQPIAIVEDRNGESFELRLADSVLDSNWKVVAISNKNIVFQNRADNEKRSLTLGN